VRQAVFVRETASAALALPHRSKQTSTCASNMNSKPQWDGSARRCRDFIRLPTVSAAALSNTIAAGTSAELRFALLLAGIGFYHSFRIRRRIVGAGADRKRCPPAPAIGSGATAADLPDALTETQPETLTVSASFLRPPPGNWQAASRILRETGHFAPTPVGHCLLTR